MSPAQEKLVEKSEAEFTPDEIRGELPHAGLLPTAITPQQEKYIHHLVNGMSESVAAAAVGTTMAAVNRWKANPTFTTALEHIRTRLREKFEFGIEDAHRMYMEAWATCTDAIQMRAVVDSLVKLHGIAVAPKATEVNVNIRNSKQLERMPDAKLLEAAGKESDYLDPKPIQRGERVVEASFEETKPNEK